MPPVAGRWFDGGWRRTPGRAALPTNLPVVDPDDSTVASEGDPQGLGGKGRSGEGWFHPVRERGVIRSGMSLGAPVTDHQQPLATDHSLSHQQLNESSLVVVGCSPASDEYRRVGGWARLPHQAATSQAGSCTVT